MSNRGHKAKSSERVHVISRDKHWAIKKEGSSRASKIHQTKEAAVNSTQKLRRRGHDVIIHKRDGSIERWEKSKK